MGWIQMTHPENPSLLKHFAKGRAVYTMDFPVEVGCMTIQSCFLRRQFNASSWYWWRFFNLSFLHKSCLFLSDNILRIISTYTNTYILIFSCLHLKINILSETMEAVLFCSFYKRIGVNLFGSTEVGEGPASTGDVV